MRGAHGGVPADDRADPRTDDVDGRAWVIAEYPVPAIAEDAGMTLAELEQFIFDAVLLDWDAEGERMRAIADLFDRAKRFASSGPTPM